MDREHLRLVPPSRLHVVLVRRARQQHRLVDAERRPRHRGLRAGPQAGLALCRPGHLHFRRAGLLPRDPGRRHRRPLRSPQAADHHPGGAARAGGDTRPPLQPAGPHPIAADHVARARGRARSDRRGLLGVHDACVPVAAARPRAPRVADERDRAQRGAVPVFEDVRTDDRLGDGARGSRDGARLLRQRGELLVRDPRPAGDTAASCVRSGERR